MRARGIPAISCGTNTTAGRPADPVAITEAARRGVDLSTHRTSRWQDIPIGAGDLVVATQLKHALVVLPRARANNAQVVVMSSLLPKFGVVWDPYGREAQAFVEAFELIDRAVDRLVELAQEARKALSTQ